MLATVAGCRPMKEAKTPMNATANASKCCKWTQVNMLSMDTGAQSCLGREGAAKR